MKRFAWIMSLLICALCTAYSKDRIVERPPFLAWSSTSIEIDKIVMSDTVTTVYIKAFYHPKNWIKIATGSYLKDSNGTLYPIRKGVGITLDKEFWIPESGEAEFQLLFPPIPKSVTCVDFSEGDFDRAFKIWGIQLDKKAFDKFELPEDITLQKANAKMALPQPTFNHAKAILKGRILDFKESMPDKGEIYAQSIIGDKEENIQIQKDGTFHHEMDVFTVTPCTLMLPFGNIDYLLAPGETTSIVVNLRESARKQSHLHQSKKPYGKEVYYSGYLAGLQQELADHPMNFDFNKGAMDKEYEQQIKEAYGKTPEEYKDSVLALLPEFKKQILQSKRSPAYKEIQQAKLDLSAAKKIIEMERILKLAYILTHGLEGEEGKKYYLDTQLDIPQEYYESLKEFPSIISPKAYYSYMYPVFIDFAFRVNMNEKVMKTFSETGGNLIKDIKANMLAASIKDLAPLTDEQKMELTTLPAACREMIVEMNNDLLKKIEINKKKSGFTINEVGEVSNEDLFPSIISKFRGHTLLVDFWATWCGPCRMANTAITPMKKELKDKDIIYIYVTGETSPLSTWKNMIPDIHGEHYRVTKAQWSYLMTNLKIEGVPTYFAVDKEGNITYRETGFPGVNIMKAELIKALNK